MDSERRINLRVDQEMYKRLDDKRHAEGQSWQSLGLGFFIEWLAGERPTPPKQSDVQLTEDDHNLADRLAWWIKEVKTGAHKGTIYEALADMVLTEIKKIKEE